MIIRSWMRCVPRWGLSPSSSLEIQRDSRTQFATISPILPGIPNSERPFGIDLDSLSGAPGTRT